jgi:hypothetical protein
MALHSACHASRPRLKEPAQGFPSFQKSLQSPPLAVCSPCGPSPYLPYLAAMCSHHRSTEYPHILLKVPRDPLPLLADSVHPVI